jgi:hypothetical protein
MQEGSKKAILAAFLANSAIAVSKMVGFVLTGAASMLAESVHSFADAGNQGLLFLGGARARKTATPEHPFGYGRERYFWSFVVALVLFTLGGLFALFEGIEKLRHPHEIESATVAFVILTLAIVVEAFSFRTAIKESLHVKGKEPAQGEQDQGDHEAPEIPLPAVAEGVLGRGRLAGARPAQEEQALVAGVGEGVDRLGQHRRCPGQDEADQLGDRDRQVRQERGDDCLLAAILHGAGC